MGLRVNSPVFSNGSEIPRKYTCDGQNATPPLEWSGVPEQAKSLAIICDDPDDLPVPGRRYSFGVVKAAQALGDFRVLQERGRRALRVHLGSDVKAGLALLGRALEA